MNSTSESLLLRLKRADDQLAWSKFVRLYTPLLFHWARRTGMQATDAADIVQEVLAICFRKLPDFQYDRTRSFRSWLRTITLNKFRESRRIKSAGQNNATDSQLADIPDQNSLAESTWDVSYHRSLFSAAMEILKPEFRPLTWRAVRKYITSDRPAADIAAETGVSIWTIYAAKSRLLSRLREELDGLVD